MIQVITINETRMFEYHPETLRHCLQWIKKSNESKNFQVLTEGNINRCFCGIVHRKYVPRSQIVTRKLYVSHLELRARA